MRFLSTLVLAVAAEDGDDAGKPEVVPEVQPQVPPAPPTPPAPPAKPTPPVETPNEAKDRALKAAAGVAGAMSGHWHYGIYKESEKISMQQCAANCETDEQCYHWTYDTSLGDCHYRGDDGFAETDGRDEYVYGNSKRYSPKKGDL